MKAIRFVGVKQPAQIADVPAPGPGFGEVVVAVEAPGLCHSDLRQFRTYPRGVLVGATRNDSYRGN